MPKSKKPTLVPPPTVPADAAPKRPRPDSKFAGLIALLERENGATIEELTKLTGWQAHSVRGVLSGALKTRFGLTVTSEKSESGRIYRVAKAPVAA